MMMIGEMMMMMAVRDEAVPEVLSLNACERRKDGEIIEEEGQKGNGKGER